jgi:hypothetical protein
MTFIGTQRSEHVPFGFARRHTFSPAGQRRAGTLGEVRSSFV